MISRWLTRLAVPAVAVPAALALTATGAQAHATSISEGLDFAAVASDHRTMTVCDRENDGSVVEGHFRLSNGHMRVVLDQVAGGSCEIQKLPYIQTVVEYRVCELSFTTSRCSGYRRA